MRAGDEREGDEREVGEREVDEWLANRQHVWRWRRWVLVRALVAAAILGLVAGIFTSAAFRCRVIYLDGPDAAVLGRVQSLLADLGPTSTIFCRRAKLAALAMQCLAVAQVHIRVLSAHALEMNVEPRMPAAALSPRGQPKAWMVADRTGMVFEAVAKAPAKLVKLEAFPTPAIGVGRRLPPDAAALYGEVLDGLRDSGVKYAKVDFTRPAEVVAYLSDGTPVKVGGFDNLERKLAEGGWVWQGARNKGMVAEYVDVRIPSRPVFLPKPTSLAGVTKTVEKSTAKAGGGAAAGATAAGASAAAGAGAGAAAQAAGGAAAAGTAKVGPGVGAGQAGKTGPPTARAGSQAGPVSGAKAQTPGTAQTGQ